MNSSKISELAPPLDQYIGSKVDFVPRGKSEFILNSTITGIDAETNYLIVQTQDKQTYIVPPYIDSFVFRYQIISPKVVSIEEKA